MKTYFSRKTVTLALVIITSAIIFILNFFIPLGFIWWFAPLFIVYLGLPSRYLIPAAIFFSILILFNLFFSPNPVHLEYIIFNRILGIALFFLLVILFGRQKRNQYYIRTLIETSPDALIIIRPDGVISDVNETTIDATGVSRKKIIGTGFSDYFTEPEKAETIYKKVLSEGVIKNYPLNLRHTSGMITPVLYNAKTYKNENGKTQGVFVAARDITELKKMEEELQIILDSVPAWIFFKDKENRFIRVNKAFADVMKMPKEQLEGRSIPDLFPKEQAEAFWKDDMEVINSLESKRNIIEPMSTEGETMWVQTDKIPYLDENGNCIGIIGFTLDITKRKKAEEELLKYRDHLKELVDERTAKLESEIAGRKQIEEKLRLTLENLIQSNKELEQFAYVASHDLQEPLRMVSSYTQLLEQRYTDKLDEDAHEFIHYAVDGATRMQRLINDLLEYSRVTTKGKEFSEVDAHSVLGQVISNLQMKIEASNAIITNSDLPEVKADGLQLARVFQNLIDNAIKFIGEESPRIHVDGRLKDGYWLFSVKDNGIGIDSRHKDRIFQIFQRLENREKYPGTGIGLAICKRIVERHGGKIWMESEPGKGTAFLFTIKK